MIEVLRCRPDTLLQDLGRPGLSSLGVSRSGPADRTSFRLANRLVGNAEQAAAFEVTLGALTLRFRRAAMVAVTGAEVYVRASRAAGAGMNCVFLVRRGSTLELTPPRHGLRSYVAVRGGIDVAPVLGARATDVLTGIGPPRVTAGDKLKIGTLTSGWPVVDLAPAPPVPHTHVLQVIPTSGFADLFGPPDEATGGYTVGQNSNRTALRLVGRALTIARGREASPQGLVAGAVQVPPDGQPVVFLAEHPVTGGYPVVGVLAVRSIDAAAQMRPGEVVELRGC
jgi:biotin-dependent carboxylase-like uncharacterized protein